MVRNRKRHGTTGSASRRRRLAVAGIATSLLLSTQVFSASAAPGDTPQPEGERDTSQPEGEGDTPDPDDEVDSSQADEQVDAPQPEREADHADDVERSDDADDETSVVGTAQDGTFGDVGVFAVAPSQEWVTDVGAVTGTGVGETRTLTFGGTGVTAQETTTSVTGTCQMSAGGYPPGPNTAGEFWEPDPDAASTRWGRNNCPPESARESTVQFSAPVLAPILHIANLEASRLVVSGTDVGGNPISISPIVANPTLDVSGNTINDAVALAINDGCMDVDGGNPNGGCGSFRLESPAPIESFAFNNNSMPGFPPGTPGSGDTWLWTLSFPTAQLTKSFDPAQITEGETSELTFSVTNPDETTSVTLSPMGFTDDLPAGVTVADTTVTDNGACGSPTVTGGNGDPLAVGATTIDFTDVSVDPGDTCEVTVTVTAAAGEYVNNTENLTSSVANLIPDADTTLTVDEAPQSPAPFECGSNAAGILVQESPANLYEIDMVTGEFDLTGAEIYSRGLNAIGYNVLDDYIYGFVPLSPQTMVRIGGDGSVEEMGLPAGVPAVNHNTGDVDENGQFWISTQNATGPNDGWRQIDLAPGSPTYGEVVASGPITGGNIEDYRGGPDWAYVPSGGDYLYRVMHNQAGDQSFLFRFNRTTHQFENLGGLGDLGAGNLFGAVYADSEFLYASNNDTGEIFRIDVHDVSATLFAQGPASTGNDGARCFLSPILIDFGDAPDSYGTTLASDGARHGIPGFDTDDNTAPLMLGAGISHETDGQPGPDADGDTFDDGVAGPIVMLAGQSTTVTVSATNSTDQPATLAGWIDLNGDGTFDEDELVYVTVPADSGTAEYELTFPEATAFGDTYARFRLFPAEFDNEADILPTGPASAGEVEDYLVGGPVLPPWECTADGILFQYPGNSGPTAVRVVDMVTGEFVEPLSIDGRAINAIGYHPLDNYIYGWDNVNDEIVRVGSDGTVEGLGLPDGWPATMDDESNTAAFDADGTLWLASGGAFTNDELRWVSIDMDPASADYFTVTDSGVTPIPGSGNLADWAFSAADGNLYAIHEGAAWTYTRLMRFDTATGQLELVENFGELTAPDGVTPSGAWGAVYSDADGFIYASNNSTGQIWRFDPIAQEADFFTFGPDTALNDGTMCHDASIRTDLGDAPDSYGTTLAADGARHGIPGYDPDTNTAPLMLGDGISHETDGQPGPDADGDTFDDGVADPIVMAIGQPTTVTVSATNNTNEDTTLAGWIDLNGDGTFDEDELVYVTVPADSGTAEYELTFPEATAFGDTYARFRLFPGEFDNEADILPTGPASAGEVEDYLVTVDIDVPPPLTCPADETRATERWWFFGQNGAIDFDVSGTTAAPFVGNQATQEGSTVVTDTAGQLQFWSNGQTVFDRNGNPMPNGTGLLGNPSATQTVAAFPAIGQPGIYYVVTTSTDVGSTANGSLTYSVVDMSLNGGLGDVVDGAKSLPLGAPNTASEAIVAAPSADGETFWLLTYTNNSPNILAYEFGPDGPITGDPVVSVMPSDNYNGYGSLNFSADMTQLVALTSFYRHGDFPQDPSKVRLLRFDAASGRVYQDLEWQLPEGAGTGAKGYTADFSPDGDYVYATKIFDGGQLYRYRIADAATGADVKATEEHLGLIGVAGGQVKRAPDGRMYIANHNGSTLSVVNDPDNATDPDFASGGFPLPGGATSRFGLPQMVTGCPPPQDFDFGDAPESYGTLLEDDGPRHLIPDYDPDTNTSPLMLGQLIDAEDDGIPTPGADGDDLDNVDDEDGVADPIVMVIGQETTVDVFVTNETDEPATLAGWIDMAGNGTFDPDEFQWAVIEPNFVGTVTLTWPAPGTPGEGTYARFRLFPGEFDDPADISPTGPASGGEVEDYTVIGPLAISIDCATVYAQQGGSPFSIYEVDTDSGDMSVVAQMGIDQGTDNNNALGFSADGRYIFSARMPNNVFVYDTHTGDTERLAAPVGPVSHGAVDPSTGIFYYGGLDGSTAIAYGFDPSTGTSLGEVARISFDVAPPAGFGDWAFDSLGNMYASFGSAGGSNALYAVSAPFPTTPQAPPATLQAQQIATITTGAGINGAAFDGGGFLYLASGAEIFQVHPSSGQVLHTAPLSPSGESVDLGSCATPATITVQKDIVDRVADGDQFEVTVTGGGMVDNPSGTTTGDDTGIQDEPGEFAGPILGFPGETYDISESGASGTDLDQYVSSWECVNRTDDDAVVASGSGAAGSFTMPESIHGIGAAVVCTFVNEPGPQTDLDKTLVDVVENGDGTWTVNYTLEVTQTGQDGTYDLSDELAYSDYVTIEEVTAGNADPGDVPVNGGFDGETDTTIATGVPIAAGDIHLYTVEVVIAIDAAEVDFDSSDCDPSAGGGTGLFNTATVTANGEDITDEECQPVPGTPEIDKAITDGPSPVGDGTYALTYTVTVTNVSAGAGTYTLTDELAYGEDITVVDAVVANVEPGDIDTDPDWDGIDETLVAADVTIAGAVDASTPSIHTYEVTVIADVDPAIAPDAADCDPATGEGGSGFFNRAVLESNGVPSDDTACEEAPRTDFDKVLTAVTPTGDGTYTLSYELTVTRSGQDGTYDLSDTLRLNEAVTVDGAAVVNTEPGDIDTNPDFDGSATPEIATNVPITADDTHVYAIDVDVSVDPDLVTPENSDCVLADGEDGTGAMNTATLTIDGQDRDGTACVEFPATSVTKDVIDGPTALGDGTYELTYTISVTNNGAGADTYDLTDELTYGDGVGVVSAAVSNTEPGDIDTNADWDGIGDVTVVIDQPIEGATVDDGLAEHVYTVTVQFEVDPQISAEDATCGAAGGGTGSGLMNTATVESNSGISEDEACTDVPRTEFGKELASVVSNGDGTYTLTYELAVSQFGHDGAYDLADDLLLSDAVTVGGVSVANVVPGDVEVNDDFDGSSDTVIASGVDIAAGGTHTYEVVVDVSVALDEVTYENSNCELGSDQSGTGAMNSATLTVNGTERDADACEPFPATSVDKQVASGPTPVGDGAYEIVYTITATNAGAGVDTYTLDDELAYGDGIAVESAQITDVDPGDIATNPGWDGQGDVNVVTDQPIDGATADGPAVHTYEVSVVVSGPVDLDPADASCEAGPGGAGRGLFNTVTLTGDSGPSEAEACGDFPTTAIDKTLTEVAGNGDGTYTLTYELEVTRTGDGPAYTLTDELAYGGAVTVESVTAANTQPGGIVTNDDFDGVDDTVVAAGVDIAADETHLYTVEVVVSIEADEVTLGNSDCDLADGEDGTGFLNTATVAVNGDTADDEECEPLPAEPLVDKTITEGPTPIGGGQYELTYEITATNPGAGAGTYTLDDELRYGDGITVESATVSNTDPGDIATNPNWDGQGAIRIVADQPIGPATGNGPTTHTYTVTVIAHVPLDLPAEEATCDADGGPDGGGFLNQTTITVNGAQRDASDCEEPPVISIDKSITDGPTPLGDDTYEITYTITVDNASGGAGAYTVDDELTYGDGVTVVDADLANTTPGGITTNPDWEGIDDTLVVADQPIDGNTTHVYTVTVTAEVAPDITAGNADCDPSTGGDGTGFMNSATLTVNGVEQDDDACTDVPRTDLDKELADVVPNGDGTYTLNYELTVTRSGQDGTYDLTDELTYGAAVTVDDVIATNTQPGDIVTNPGFDGIDDPVIVGGVDIPAGHTHTYAVTVTATVDAAGITPGNSDCELADGEDGTGFLNQATLTIDSSERTDTACEDIAATSVDKTITDGPTANGDGTFTLTYELRATNSGAGADTYDLTDELASGDGVGVVSASVSNTAPGGIATNPDWDGEGDVDVVTDQPIGGATVEDGPTEHVYTATVTFTVAADITPEAADCELADGEAGTGLLNTATVNGDSGPSDDSECTPVPRTEFDKELASVVSNRDGTYTLTYELAVSQFGHDGAYDLADDLLLSDAVTVGGVSVANVVPGDVEVNDDFDGVDSTLIASGVDIAAGDTHTYEVVVEVSVALDEVTYENSNCELGSDQAGTGAMNSATLTVNGTEREVDACEPFPATSVDKQVASGPTPVGDGAYEIVYTITATNAGAGEDTYTIDDELLYGDGIEVEAATVVNAIPGDITTNPGWDGEDDVNVVTDQPIDGATADGPAVHTYEVSVIVSGPVDLDPADASCTDGPGGAGSGLFNTVILTGDSGTSEAEACEDFPSTAIDKTLAELAENGDGTYTLIYELAVSRTGDGPAYDLDDELRYGGAVTVESVTAANTQPGGIATNDDFDGIDDTRIASGVDIADGDTHVYTVEVVVSIEADEVTLGNSDCDLGTGPGDGTGFLNTATVTVNGDTADDEECEPLPAEPLVDKTITEGPTPIGGGQYELTYEVTATNPGAGTGTYTLDDELAYGDGITVDSAAVSNTAPGGIATNPDWDGQSDTTVVVDQPIEAATGNGPAVHTYTVTVIASLPLDLPVDEATCDADGGPDGGGFLNRATITVNGEQREATDCEDAPTTDIVKTLVDTVANGDGTWTLTYELEVARTGDGPAYDLDDELRYGGAVTAGSVSAANTQPGGIATNDDFDGIDDTRIASGVDIADGDTHIYTVEVTANVDVGDVTLGNSDCDLGTGPGDGTGFLNTATVTSNDSTISDDECEEFPATDVDKQHVSGPTPLGDGRFELTYEITATNTGAGDGTYTLDDQLRYGDGITVESAEVTNTTPGGIVTDPDWDGLDDTTVVVDQPIDAATADGPTTHIYTVTVVALVPNDLSPEAADCELGDDEDGTGFLNEASVGGDSGPRDDTSCVVPPVNEFDKELADIISLGDRQFELVYELTVERVQGGDATYTLTDNLMFGESLTIEGVSAANTSPGDIATNGGFDGDADQVIAADVAIGDGDVHTYEVRVVVTVDVEAVTAENSDCELGQGEAGTGTMNRAGLDADGITYDAEDCEEFPSITIIKDVLDGPTPLGDGNWGVRYEITVMNSGAGDGEYDLDDELGYGGDIEILTAELTNTAGGVTTNPDWDGIDDTTIVVGQPIDGATDGGPAIHTYEVYVTSHVPAGTPTEVAECGAGGSGPGSGGFVNTATLTVGEDVDDNDACVDVPRTDIDKELTSITPNGDGTYTLDYELTVTRSGDGPAYTLTDELRYGGAVVVESVSAANTQPGDVATNDAFDGVDDTMIVDDVLIADGETHVYAVTVIATVDGESVTFENTDCELAGGESGTGFLNEASVTANDTTETDDDCERASGGIRHAKDVTDGPNPLGDGRYEVMYTITVVNHAAGDDSYTLDDELAYGDGIEIASTEVANASPGDITTEPNWDGQANTRVVTDQPIAGAGPGEPTIHTYTVRVVADVSAGVSLEAGDCTLGDGEDGTGLLNRSHLETNGVESSDEACTEVPAEDELQIAKNADVTEVSLGGEVTYTIDVTNIGTVNHTAENPAVVVDDLTDVIDDAAWVGNEQATAGELTYDEPELTWTGPLAAGDTVSISYTVQVNETITGNGELFNTVSAEGNTNCPPNPGDNPECSTTTPIEDPSTPPAPTPQPPAPTAPRSPITPDPVPVTG